MIRVSSFNALIGDGNIDVILVVQKDWVAILYTSILEPSMLWECILALDMVN